MAAFSAQAEEQGFQSKTISYYLNAPFLPTISFDGSVELNPIYDIPGLSKPAKSASGFTSINATRFQFSKNPKVQYGLELSLDQAWNNSLKKEEPQAAPTFTQNRFSTAVFLNYQVSPHYTLSASLRQLNGREQGTQFSIGAKVNKAIHRHHRLDAYFSVNWTKPNQANWSSLNSRSLADYSSFNLSSKTRAELRLGASWNWTINPNWSLSTGVQARHFQDHDKAWLHTQRSPVTVFSVLSYRF